MTMAWGWELWGSPQRRRAPGGGATAPGTRAGGPEGRCAARSAATRREGPAAARDGGPAGAQRVGGDESQPPQGVAAAPGATVAGSRT